MMYLYLCTKTALPVEGRWIKGEGAGGGETLSGAVCDHLVKVVVTWIQLQLGRGEDLHEVLKRGILWTEWRFAWGLGQDWGEELFCKGRQAVFRGPLIPTQLPSELLRAVLTSPR